ncbi:MAG: VPLPA-CTERM sorting domain-containing protein [Pseudomonadota bacterium]
MTKTLRTAAIALLSFGAISAATPSKAVVLDDFDSGLPINGTVTPGAGSLSFEVTTIGLGLCAGYSGGSGGAICFNGDDISGTDAAVLSYEDVLFNDGETLFFTLATTVNPGAGFEAADFINISVGFDTDMAPGNDTFVTIASLVGNTGTGSFDPNPGNPGIASFGSTNSTFQTISAPVDLILDNAGIGGTSFLGDLVFTVSISTVNEFVAFDSVSTEVVPVPAALPLLLGGLGALAFVARRRSRQEA